MFLLHSLSDGWIARRQEAARKAGKTVPSLDGVKKRRASNAKLLNGDCAGYPAVKGQ
jgi:hypothetical protein